MLRANGTLFALVTSVCVFGCNKKIDECNALIKQINESSTAVQQQTTGLMSNPKEAKESLTKLASATKEATDKISTVELSVKELADFSQQYQKMLTETVAAATKMGEATGELEGIQESLTTTRKEWLANSGKIRIACIKPEAKKECDELGEKVTKPPMVTGIKPDEDAKKLDEYAKGIAEVKVENEDLKAAVDSVQKSLTGFSDALKKMAAVKEKVETATKDMTEATKKEPELIKNINDFCQAG